MTHLNDTERAVLAAFIANEKADPEGTWACYHHSILEVTGGKIELAEVVCRNLRAKKLLKGEGRATHATYYPTDAGKAAVA